MICPKIIKALWILTISLGTIFCSFGSTGNNLTDKKIIITSLAVLRASIKTNVSLQFFFFDDRGDNALESFQLTSGTNSDLYTVTLTESSKISVASSDFYISTTSTSMADSTAIEFHTADSGSNTQVGAVTKVYSTSKNYSTSTFIKVNGADENGVFSSSEQFSLNELPQGLIKQVILKLNGTIFSGTLNSPGQSKAFTVEFSPMDISFSRLCSNTLGLNQGVNLRLDIQYSNLFKDTSSSTAIDNTKILRAIADLPTTKATISATHNAAIYAEIVKNWNFPATIKEHGCTK